MLKCWCNLVFQTHHAQGYYAYSFQPFSMLFSPLFEAKIFKKCKNNQFFRFFVTQPSEENSCWRPKYDDLLETRPFFWMYTLHVMIWGIKKMPIYFGLDFVALSKSLTKNFVTKKGQKRPFLARLANKRWKNRHFLFMQPIQNLYFSESTHSNLW